MAEILGTWEQVWKRGTQANCTHYNYSRGEKRFRPILDEPLPIGEEPNLDSDKNIRIRFFTLINEEYVENEELDCWFAPDESVAMSVPPDFESWPHMDQQSFLRVSLERISAGRYARQMDQAEKMIHRFLEHLMRQINAKDARIAELQNQVNELASARGVANIYEFLVHPNANQIVETILNGLKSVDSTKVVDEVKRLANARIAASKESGTPT